MFKTFMGPVEESASVVYLRPETAQGIFVNFKNVRPTTRIKVPFGIAQIGKSFRNEITPGNFIFRSREFEQMEMEFFVKPGEDDKWFEYWTRRGASGTSRSASGPRSCACGRTPATSWRTTPRAAPTSSTSSRSAGRSSRASPTAPTSTCKRHSEFSGKDLTFFDEEKRERYMPYVIEPAAGADRATLAFLVDAYDEDVADGEARIVLRLHPQLAPIKAAMFPLVHKDGHPEKAHEIDDILPPALPVDYDQAGAIGRRYRRQDEIGTPFCITVDSRR